MGQSLSALVLSAPTRSRISIFAPSSVPMASAPLSASTSSDLPNGYTVAVRFRGGSREAAVVQLDDVHGGRRYRYTGRMAFAQSLRRIPTSSRTWTWWRITSPSRATSP